MSEHTGLKHKEISCRISGPLEQLHTIEEVQAAQIIMLNSLFSHSAKSPFYSHRIGDRRIKTLDELSAIPLLTREEASEFGALQSHEMETGERENGWIFRSTGSSGKPFFSVRTREDVDIHLSRAGRFMTYVLGPHDVVFNCNFMGAGWSGGISAHDFLSRTNAMSIGLGSHLTPAEYIEFWKEICPNSIIGMPSFLKKLASSVGDEEGLSKVDKIFFVGEPFWADEREFVRQKIGTPATKFFGHYANTECGAVGMQVCDQARDDVYHIIPDGNIVEIVHPDTLEPVEQGKPGKIVLTSFNRLHKPIIRLVTDDLGSLQSECPCGLHTQMLEVFGKSAGELVYIGDLHASMSKFISHIINELATHGVQTPNKQIQLSRDGHNTCIDVFLESTTQNNTQLSQEVLYELLSHSSAQMGTISPEDLHNVRVSAKFVPMGTIQGVGTAGKMPLIVDKRK